MCLIKCIKSFTAPAPSRTCICRLSVPALHHTEGSRLAEWTGHYSHSEDLDSNSIIRNQSALLKCPSVVRCILSSHFSKENAQDSTQEKENLPAGTNNLSSDHYYYNWRAKWDFESHNVKTMSVTLGYFHCEACWLRFHRWSCSIYVVRCVLSGWQHMLRGLLLHVWGCHSAIIKLTHPVQKYHALGETSEVA